MNKLYYILGIIVSFIISGVSGLGFFLLLIELYGINYITFFIIYSGGLSWFVGMMVAYFYGLFKFTDFIDKKSKEKK